MQIKEGMGVNAKISTALIALRQQGYVYSTKGGHWWMRKDLAAEDERKTLYETIIDWIEANPNRTNIQISEALHRDYYTVSSTLHRAKGNDRIFKDGDGWYVTGAVVIKYNSFGLVSRTNDHHEDLRSRIYVMRQATHSSPSLRDSSGTCFCGRCGMEISKATIKTHQQSDICRRLARKQKARDEREVISIGDF